MKYEKEQKYFSEFALLNASQSQFLLRPADIDNAYNVGEYGKEILKDSHIYCICTRPRLEYNAEDFIFTENYIEGEYKLLSTANNIDRKFKINRKMMPHEITKFDVKIKPGYMVGLDKNDKNIISFPISLAPSFFYRSGDSGSLMDAKVVYIGQGYGKQGEIDAVTRLKSHSTLQKIIASVHANDYLQDVIIVILQYATPQFVISMDGHGKPKINGNDDWRHARDIVSHKIDGAKNVTIIEASLIKHFQPHYNKVYKDSFPSTNLEILRDSYDLDVSAIITEIDTEDVAIKLYSDKCNPNYHHITEYNLHSDSDRRGFFDLPMPKTNESNILKHK